MRETRRYADGLDVAVMQYGAECDLLICETDQLTRGDLDQAGVDVAVELLGDLSSSLPAVEALPPFVPKGVLDRLHEYAQIAASIGAYDRVAGGTHGDLVVRHGLVAELSECFSSHKDANSDNFLIFQYDGKQRGFEPGEWRMMLVLAKQGNSFRVADTFAFPYTDEARMAELATDKGAQDEVKDVVDFLDSVKDGSYVIPPVPVPRITPLPEQSTPSENRSGRKRRVCLAMAALLVGGLSGATVPNVEEEASRAVRQIGTGAIVILRDGSSLFSQRPSSLEDDSSDY